MKSNSPQVGSEKKGSHTAAVERPNANDVLNEIRRRQPWATLVYRLLQLLRRWLITLFGLPFLFIFRSQLSGLLLTSGLVFLIFSDLLARKRAWDVGETENDLASAIIQNVPCPYCPSELEANVLVRQVVLLVGINTVICLVTAAALHVVTGEALPIVAAFFVGAAVALSLVGAAFISVNASALLIMRNNGRFDAAKKMATAFKYIDAFPPIFYFLPRRFFLGAAMICMLPILLLVVSAHAFVVGAVAFEARSEGALLAAGTFVFQVAIGFVLATMPKVYLTEKVSAETS